MNSRVAFVVIGLAVNLLVLIRGVVLMGTLDYADLGMVALAQSALLFVGILHFGLLNGGYRLLCHAGPAYRQRIVNMAYTFFLFLALAVAIVAFGAIIVMDTAIYKTVAAVTAIGGICTLVRAWMINEMVAGQQLKAVNLNNALSVVASLAILPFLWVQPTLMGVLSIVIQPVVFVATAFATGSTMRPIRLEMSKRLAGTIFKVGFIMFLTGLATQLNTQMERWYVTAELGLDDLGRLYLAFLFLTLFQMTPSLLDQIFLPNIVRARKAFDVALLRKEMRNFLLITLVYCGLAGLALATLAEPILAFFLPKYVPDLQYVFLLAPGLIGFALSGPFAIVFNAVIDYRWYVVSYGLGALATALAFGTAFALGTSYDLDGVVVIRSLVYALMALVIVFGWWRISARFPEFRLMNRVAS